MASSKSRITLILLSSLLALLCSAPIIVLMVALQTQSSLPQQPQLSRAETSRIEELLLENTPPSPSNASLQQLHLNNDELNLLLRYSTEVLGLAPNWLAQATLSEGLLRTDLSVNVSAFLLPLFLNLHAEFGVHDNTLELDNLYFGELQLPNRFLRFALNRIKAEIQSSNSAYQDFSELLQSVESVAIEPGRMNVMLNWDPALLSRITNQAQQIFISAVDQKLIIAHYQRITDIAVTIPADLRAVSLNTFLVPLFAAALQNSRDGSDPIAENRTLLQTLAVYVNNEGIDQLIGTEQAAELEKPRVIEIRLHRRQDLAQHLVSIAAISASAGADIAAMLSTTKEAYDARYRSGFSFSDLTANTVGVTLATLATRDRSTAMLMQERIAQITNESEYMPEVGSNRDGLSESDFNALYQDRNSEEYQLRLLEIQELIATRTLFQDI